MGTRVDIFETDEVTQDYRRKPPLLAAVPQPVAVAPSPPRNIPATLGLFLVTVGFFQLFGCLGDSFFGTTGHCLLDLVMSSIEHTALTHGLHDIPWWGRTGWMFGGAVLGLGHSLLPTGVHRLS